MDREKFKELVVYLARKADADPLFGDTRLNKLLYFADFLAYQHLGRPITGARYQKLQHGPAPRALLPIRQELEREGAVKVERRGRAFPRTVTIACRDADTSLFTPEELELVDEIVESLHGVTAADVSELAHEQSPGWRLARMNEDIPYESALLSTDPPPAAVIQRGRELADRYGW